MFGNLAQYKPWVTSTFWHFHIVWWMNRKKPYTNTSQQIHRGLHFPSWMRVCRVQFSVRLTVKMCGRRNNTIYSWFDLWFCFYRSLGLRIHPTKITKLWFSFYQCANGVSIVIKTISFTYLWTKTVKINRLICFFVSTNISIYLLRMISWYWKPNVFRGIYTPVEEWKQKKLCCSVYVNDVWDYNIDISHG